MLTSIGVTSFNTGSTCPMIDPTPPSDIRKLNVDGGKLDMMPALAVAQCAIVHSGNFHNFFCLTRFEVGILLLKNIIASVKPSPLFIWRISLWQS